MTAITRPRILRISVREAKLVTSRILLTLRLPSGCILAIRDTILLSQASRLGGFVHLRDAYDRLTNIRYEAMTLREIGSGELSLDGNGIHAWLINPTIADLAVDLARQFGIGKVYVTNVTAPEELGVVKALATRHGAVAEINLSGSNPNCSVVSVRNNSRPQLLEDWDPLLFAAIRNHFAIEETLWLVLNDLSNKALAPDSVVSRRHAGPNILLDDGTVVGRLPADDDFDPKMLQVTDPTKIGERSTNDRA